MGCPSSSPNTPQAPDGSHQLLFPQVCPLILPIPHFSQPTKARNLLTHPPSSFWPPPPPTFHGSMPCIFPWFSFLFKDSAYTSSSPRQLPRAPRWRTAHLVRWVQLTPVTSYQIISKYPSVTVLQTSHPAFTAPGL